ncbi:hypothetical protein GURASL_34840 [Geotalea uraniireducens]|uniref:Uncharacterized protein n=1 Tax=Geotalea uraniireducens TaxID=351604 RepID=A0ABM8EPN5_9BACT|nr:hypothetical protein GURASL_34840 [Geotalea uraniireducens]
MTAKDIVSSISARIVADYSKLASMTREELFAEHDRICLSTPGLSAPCKGLRLVEYSSNH